MASIKDQDQINLFKKHTFTYVCFNNFFNNSL